MRSVTIVLLSVSLLLFNMAQVALAEPPAEDEMKNLNAIAILEKEHQAVSAVAKAAVKEAQTIEESGRVDMDRVQKMHTFFHNFVDRCHHGKEEEYLFPTVHEDAQRPLRMTIRELKSDHARGRKQLARLYWATRAYQTGNIDAADTIAEVLDAYGRAIQKHAEKEDKEFFPEALTVLSDDDLAQLKEGFERIEKEVIGKGGHERYHQIAVELAHE